MSLLLGSVAIWMEVCVHLEVPALNVWLDVDTFTVAKDSLFLEVASPSLGLAQSCWLR